jgi:hypothetical protein
MPLSSKYGSTRPGPASQTQARVTWFLTTLFEQRWSGFVISMAAHAMLVAMVFLGLPVRPLPKESTSPSRSEVILVSPEGVEKSLRRQPDSASQPFDARPVIESGEQNPSVRVDMNSIQLSFADDVTNQLPGVVTEWGGALALMDKDDPSFARYLILPPDWSVRRTLLDASGKFRLAMDPPRKWNLLRIVAEQNSIDLDRYQVCALFEGEYSKCLRSVILLRANQLSDGKSVRVRSARLVFEVGRPCGVNVLEVTFVPVSNR